MASRIQPGRWKMRNGSIAVVTKRQTIKCGHGWASVWFGWAGHLEGHPDGDGLSWSMEGFRSDVEGVRHEHDLMTKAPTQKAKVKK